MISQDTAENVQVRTWTMKGHEHIRRTSLASEKPTRTYREMTNPSSTSRQRINLSMDILVMYCYVDLAGSSVQSIITYLYWRILTSLCLPLQTYMDKVDCFVPLHVGDDAFWMFNYLSDIYVNLFVTALVAQSDQNLQVWTQTDYHWPSMTCSTSIFQFNHNIESDQGRYITIHIGPITQSLRLTSWYNP